MRDDDVRSFIDEHASVLDSSFETTKMSDTMRRRLQESDYVFSGIKTFHELNEAFPSLLDEKGERKPFERFLNDVQTIDRTYNRNYLRTEYNFVSASSEMAGRWEDFEKDGDEYWLQYRTAGDDRVRPEHAALNGITLPPSDPFWDVYYPPNGWNCRCTVVQVPKNGRTQTPHEEAMTRGAQAMKGDKWHMFSWNPGKEGKSVPDYNPYTIQQCSNCDVAKGKMSLAKPLDCDLCKACQMFRSNDPSEKNLILENHKEYEKLKNDKDYKDVRFNEKNGGLMATHKGHNFSETAGGGAAETDVQEAGFKAGHAVILLDETGRSGKHIEGLWDGMNMEISYKNSTPNGIKKGLLHAASKPRYQVAIIVIRNDLLDIESVNKAMTKYFGLKKIQVKNNGQLSKK